MKDILIGMAVGDALGVPFEFKSRATMGENPAVDMIGHGVHNQVKGTWSDDTSMALCIVDSLLNGLNYSDMINKFTDWLRGGYWTPHGVVFDNGISTRRAIDRWRTGQFLPADCGGTTDGSNGNGSVMRTLVLVPYIEHLDIDQRWAIISTTSSLTHAHWISRFSCLLACEFAIEMRKKNKKLVTRRDAWDDAVVTVRGIRNKTIAETDEFTEEEFDKYFGEYLFEDAPYTLKDEDYRGSGFARDTAVTAIYCVLTTSSYKEAVLKAINYGDDTDTTACVTGGLAGIIYGVDGIPKDWVDCIARKDDILDLVERYEALYEVV